MDYSQEIAAILAEARTLDADTRRLGWSLARTIPDAIRRTAESKVERMKAESEPFRRIGGTEHARVLKEIEREERTVRTLAAGVALQRVEPRAARLNAQLQRLMTAMRRDTALTFPDALDRVTPNGMIMFELLREQLRPIVDRADAADLLARYTRALNTRDARGRAEAGLIEERLERGGLARSEGDLPIVKELADLVATTCDLRIPDVELGAAEEAVSEALRAASRAQVAQVLPVDPSHPANVNAKQAFERDAADYTEAVKAAAQV